MRYVAFCVLVVAMVCAVPSCAGNPPPGTYSAQGVKAYNADQLLKDIDAMSQTAINLNGQTGKLHLKDQDTRYVRDFALTAASALNTYGTQSVSNLNIVRGAFNTLTQSLSAEAKANSTFSKVLAVVAAGVNNLPQ